ncbi:hypothetical protein [Candidatus Sororendozoicomonas aggregata]|uniref:hypothetical protein n=1 Tax=Candidatus Sororendozoicomonas aggregata TaxID=3073239 RepID=UPI002ED0D9C6
MSAEEKILIKKRPRLAWNTKTKMYVEAMWLATIDLLYFVVPVGIYASIVALLGTEFSEIKALPAWSFMALAVYFAIVKDGYTAFNRKSEDKGNREFALVIGLSGIAFSTVVLTLNIIRSKDPFFYIADFTQNFQFHLLLIALLLAWMVKVIQIMRTDQEVYVNAA